ncbi:uncharacterized protein C2orf78 homolog [Arvicanthis niloticus]|uniref:uncharacterized protein C2orf78 homolog n=1 Tax=Arvicanthis niloticus TaxID=61156 RepID=UPI0014868BE8|nr:uncharacterized protein C2orf78 homolog [Arvicanthis niloticus]
MSDNYQSSPFFGAERALQPSLPVLSNSTHSGRVCNHSRVSTPDVSSARLLPSASSTSFQPLMGNAYVNPHAGTTMLSVMTEHGQISTSAPSYPGDLKSEFTGIMDGRKDVLLQEFNVTINDQDTTLSSLAKTNQCDKILDSNAILPFYPTLPASFVQVTPPKMPNQGYRLEPSYQEGSHVYYYEHNSLGPLIAEEFGQCLPAHGSVSYPGSQTSVLQPEMVMVLKEIQPRNVQIPLFTSAFSYSTSAQSMPYNSLPVVQTETSLGLPPSGQTHCQLQSLELCNSWDQVSQIRPKAVNGSRALTAPIHSPSEFLALPPAPSLEETENKTTKDIKDEFLKTLDAYEGTKEKQDTPIMALAHPDLQQPLHCTDTESLSQKPASGDAHFVGISMGLKEHGDLQNEIGSSFDLKDVTTLEADIQLPQLLNNLTDIDRDQACENWSIIRGPPDQVRKNKHKSSELLEEAPQAKIQHQDLVEGEQAVWVAGASDRAIENMEKNQKSKAPKVVPNKNRRVRKQVKERASGPGNISKKTEELKLSRNKVKGEEKPTIPKTKRKRNPPELSQNSFKKPRTNLGMHMLESVQVFHPLGKKNERKTGTSSFGGLRTFTSNKDPGTTSVVTTAVLNMPCEGQGPPKGPGKIHRVEGSANKDCLSPSTYELPPAGKVRLVPLPFPPTLDKPQARPVSRKPLSLTLQRPTTAYPVQTHSHSVQPTSLRSAQPAPLSTSLVASDKPAPPGSSRATQPNVANTIQSSAATSLASSRPAPYRPSSHTSFQREQVSAARNKVPSPPKPQTQYLLQDFSRQPIPWRKVDILGPVVSQPITKEQRPEREAMKRLAQQERENAVKKTSEKLQLFLQREKDMEISQYYGYVM